MTVKINLRIITKNHAAYPEIGLLLKLISKPNGCATAMPTAREINSILHHSEKLFRKKFCLASLILYFSLGSWCSIRSGKKFSVVLGALDYEFFILTRFTSRARRTTRSSLFVKHGIKYINNSQPSPNQHGNQARPEFLTPNLTILPGRFFSARRPVQNAQFVVISIQWL